MSAYFVMNKKINYKRDSLFVKNNNKNMNYKRDSLFCIEKIKESITNVSAYFVMNKKMNYKRDSLFVLNKNKNELQTRQLT